MTVHCHSDFLRYIVSNAITDVLEWCARQQGASSVEHYLDDYIVLGPPASSQCQTNLQTLERVCGELGVPLASHKREGFTTCLTFLGIEIDPVAGSLRLLAEKLHRLVATIQDWSDRKVVHARNSSRSMDN